MSVHEELTLEQREGMKLGDKAKVNAIRQVETEVSVMRSAKGFDTTLEEDDVYRAVISSYVKKMEKARREYVALGAAGQEHAEKLAFEVEYLSGWLPDDAVDEDAMRVIVREAVVELGVTDPKMAGRVTGHVMQSHAELDGSAVNRLVREELER